MTAGGGARVIGNRCNTSGSWGGRAARFDPHSFLDVLAVVLLSSSIKPVFVLFSFTQISKLVLSRVLTGCKTPEPIQTHILSFPLTVFQMRVLVLLLLY